MTFDPFNLKHADRDCKKCADGRLHAEPIGDTKVKLYCDTCTYWHIFTRELQHNIDLPRPTLPAEQVATDTALPPPAPPVAPDPIHEAPAEPKQSAEAIAPEVAPDPTPPLSSKETVMPQPSFGLNKTQYSRWHGAGRPDLDKFKDAGCPTPSAWRKLQGEPARRTKKKAATKKPKAPAAVATTKPTAPAKQPEPISETTKLPGADARVSIKVVSVSYEGDGASINTILQQIAGLFR